MNADRKSAAIDGINARHRAYRTVSKLYLCAILLSLLFPLFPLFLYFMSEHFDMYYMESEEAALFFAMSILVTIFSLLVFSSLYKYNETISNFWYSRGIALNLYESESDILLKDLVASLAAENVRPSTMRPSDFFPVFSRFSQDAPPK